MGIGKKITTFTVDNVLGGCNYLDDITEVAQNQSPNAMNVEFTAGKWRKRKGFRALTSTVGATKQGYSLIDFGVVSGVHKQVVHFSTTVYALSNLSGSLSTIRSAAPESRSFNAKVYSYLIQTYSDYSTPFYWDGSTATMSLLSPSAPGFKRAIEFQGFLLGMNTSANKMRVYYQATTNLLGATASYSDYFTLTPAPNDDEISDPFILNGRCYVGTKCSIFRISYVGGTTVFEFKQVLSDVGIVPGTVQVVITKEYGQVAIFLGTDRRVYMFDGANTKAISDLYYEHTDDVDIAMDLVDSQYIENATAVFDSTNRVYRLIVTRLGSTKNYYMINIDMDTFAYYPFDNMEFASAAMCYDSIGRLSLIAASYTGQLYKLFPDCNHDDGEVIKEYYESPLVSSKDSATKQGQNLTLLLTPQANSKLVLYDKVDFARGWSKRMEVPLCHQRDRFLGISTALGTTAVLGSDHKLLRQQINLPISFNTYQFKLTTDADSAGLPFCAYNTGTVAGSAGGTTVTLTSGVWVASMTSTNGYRIWVKDGGLNQALSQTFTFTTSSTAVVSALAASAFSTVAYEVYLTNCDACAPGWEMLKIEFNNTLLSVGKAEPQR
jgi:hypothetical protein